MDASLNLVILYATPRDELLEDCLRFWAEAESNGIRTSAQSYPPHCSLTGFFRLPVERLDELVQLVHAAIGASGFQGATEVPLSRVQTADWLGFSGAQPAWLVVAQQTAQAEAGAACGEGLRVKSDHHLSLAYGRGYQAQRHRKLAREVFSKESYGDSQWSIGVWKLENMTWSSLSA